MRKIVLDLETQKAFEEVGGQENAHKLGVSLVGIYDFEQDKFLSFRENELAQLFPILKASEIIGFNIKNFDLVVLRPYFAYDLQNLKTLDLLEDFVGYAGHRIKLESLAQSNLGMGKSGTGLDALKYYQEGDFEKLAKYCLDDVRITRDLYNLGATQGYLKYTSKYADGELVVPASWGRKVTTGEAMSAFARSHISRQPIEIDYLSTRITPGKNPRKLRKIQVLNFIQGGVEAQCFLKNEKRHFRPERVIDIKK